MREQIIIFLAIGMALELFTTAWLAAIKARRLWALIGELSDRDMHALVREQEMDF